ncbi:hypothetical protein PV703_07400 [Streptomyces sp. ME01-24h]|nr:hypothetical protein [Streptomyces sp. ME19-03-3]MDX3353148.1 hypothetical protein [Streptomyces sp. ME01-24h]
MSEYGNESEFQHRIEDLEHTSASAARLFDVRRVIGGLFVVYGVIVTIAGITASDADLAKAQGVNINLWTGIGMLVLGLLFLLWMRLSPPPPPPAPQETPEPGSPRPGGDD